MDDLNEFFRPATVAALRKIMQPEELDALRVEMVPVASVRQHFFVEPASDDRGPLLLVRIPEGLLVVLGYAQVEAATEEGIREIPAVVLPAIEEAAAVRLYLASNPEAAPIDVAWAVYKAHRLARERGGARSQRAFAKQVGRSVGWLNARIKIWRWLYESERSGPLLEPTEQRMEAARRLPDQTLRTLTEVSVDTRREIAKFLAKVDEFQGERGAALRAAREIATTLEEREKRRITTLSQRGSLEGGDLQLRLRKRLANLTRRDAFDLTSGLLPVVIEVLTKAASMSDEQVAAFVAEQTKHYLYQRRSR